MLILGLGVIVVFTVLGALRFARMEVAKERETFARERTKDIIFEGTLTPRAAREQLPVTLETDYAGERIRITVQRLPAGSKEASTSQPTP